MVNMLRAGVKGFKWATSLIIFGASALSSLVPIDLLSMQYELFDVLGMPVYLSCTVFIAIPIFVIMVFEFADDALEIAGIDIH